jgi:hypothetical protein
MNLKDLLTKVEQILQKQVDMNAHKVFDVEHLDFTESATTNPGGKLFETKSRSLGHGDAHDHRGTGNGVVTTLVSTPVTSAGTSNPIPPIPYALPLSTPYPVDVAQLQLNHVIPLVDFPDFDGVHPNCGSETVKITLSYMQYLISTKSG